MRDHEAITIRKFNGLWDKGDLESCPLDHFTECDNLQFLENAFRSRDGIEPYLAIPNVTRIYVYNKADGQSLLVLDNVGNIYDSDFPTTPILSIPSMTDFAFKQIAGRAYISPHDGNLGLQGEFVYVYLGDGDPARKAAGDGPTTAPSAAVSATAGNVATGYHIYAVVYETNTGFLTKLSPPVALNQVTASRKVDLTNIPVSPDTFVVARHIVATKKITPALYTGDVNGYQFFFVPDGTIEDNSTTSLSINFYDADLLEDASYLEDILEEIPAGVNLTTYHNRLITMAEFGEETGDILTSTIGNISMARLSEPGEPEAFNAVTGIIICPLDSKPLTNGQEYRDILYLFKQIKTFAITDNGDDPTSWPIVVIDEGTGAPIHGVAYVLDSGGVNIDYVIICDWSGVMLFDGKFTRPDSELSWKIENRWFELDRDEFHKIHMLNNSIQKIFYIVLPDGTMLMGNYADALNREAIKWSPWSFEVPIRAIALVNTDTLILASDGTA